MSAERWRYLNDYSSVVFGGQDDHLAGIMREAVGRGFPDIAVNAEVGRLLMIMTSLTPGLLALEVGTLAGYSGIWIARGLAPGGRLITIEQDATHAAFARTQFEQADVADRVEVREGAALDVLPALARELGPSSVDVVFLDAVKAEYSDYWRIVRPLVKPGGLVMADNVYGSGWWIGDEGDPTRAAVDRFNRMVADDPAFEAVAVPLRSGVLIGRREKVGTGDTFRK